jgi:hypothetical protein
MAIAHVNRGEAVPVVNPITHVTLDLTKQEAIALRMTMAKIGGSPGSGGGGLDPVTARAFTDSIATALADAGVPYELPPSPPRITVGEKNHIIYTPASYGHVCTLADEWK